MEDCLLDCYFLCLAIETHVYNSPCFYLLLFICLFLQDLPLSHCLFLRGENESAFHPGPHTVDDAFSLFRSKDFLLLLFFRNITPALFHVTPLRHSTERERDPATRYKHPSSSSEKEREKEPMFLAIYFKHIRRKRGKKFAFVLFNATHTVLPPSIEGKLSRDKKKINIKGENGPIIKARTSQ
jgi:hypothetical protein